MSEILQGTSEDKFAISINDAVQCFDEMDSIYIAHYYVKKPGLPASDNIKKRINQSRNEKKLFTWG